MAIPRKAEWLGSLRLRPKLPLGTTVFAKRIDNALYMLTL